ncbi:MAG: hypothetical protein J3K34DRAFT_400672 [Monoraphidium minutum]|nr:MAG: hypothetical protein J3K34DRAFT_400672 [Monoraphidium minutum]
MPGALKIGVLLGGGGRTRPPSRLRAGWRRVGSGVLGSVHAFPPKTRTRVTRGPASAATPPARAPACRAARQGSRKGARASPLKTPDWAAAGRHGPLRTAAAAVVTRNNTRGGEWGLPRRVAVAPCKRVSGGQRSYVDALRTPDRHWQGWPAAGARHGGRYTRVQSGKWGRTGRKGVVGAPGERVGAPGIKPEGAAAAPARKVDRARPPAQAGRARRRAAASAARAGGAAAEVSSQISAAARSPPAPPGWDHVVVVRPRDEHAGRARGAAAGGVARVAAHAARHLLHRGRRVHERQPRAVGGVAPLVARPLARHEAGREEVRGRLAAVLREAAEVDQVRDVGRLLLRADGGAQRLVGAAELLRVADRVHDIKGRASPCVGLDVVGHHA